MAGITSFWRKPADLIGDAEGCEVTAYPYGGPSVVGELERLRTRERQSHGRAQPRILLQIVTPNSIHVSASTGVVRAVQGRPEPGPEGITDVRLRGADRRLLAHLALKEVGVLQEEPAS